MKLVYHPLFLEPLADEKNMEKPERLQFLVDEVLSRSTSLDSLVEKGLIEIAPDGERYLELFHTGRYIKEIKDCCESLNEGETECIDKNEDTFVSSQSYKVACYAVGAAVKAAELSKKGRTAFALARPPGHHAHSDYAGGFCIFNNIAIASEYLRREGERVMIIDVDLHLGDGTLEYIEERPEETFYFSINHQGLWPHLDDEKTVELANAENIFLPEGTDDEKYVRTLDKKLIPAIERFQPTIIGVSMGFDTHSADYLNFGDRFGGGFALGKDNWAYERLKEILDNTLLPYFLVLEGGYHPLSVMSGVLNFFNK